MKTEDKRYMKKS